MAVEAPRTLLRRISYRMIAALVSVSAVLGAAELLLALWWPVSYPGEVVAAFDPDPHTGFRLRPGSYAGRAGDHVLSIDSSGLRGRDPTRALGVEGSRLGSRILILGDSMTFAAEVPAEASWPFLLEQQLQRAGWEGEVLNAAVSGWGPLQYHRFLEHHERVPRFDLLLVGFFVGNDAYDARQSTEQLNTALRGRRVSRRFATRRLAALWVELTVRSHLWRLLTGLRGQSVIRRQDCSEFSSEYLSIQSKRLVHLTPPTESRRRILEANLRHLHQMSQELAPKRQLVIVLLPDELHISEAARQAALEDLEPRQRREIRQQIVTHLPQSLISAWLAERSIEVIDVTADLRDEARARPDHCLFLDDTHLTEGGHEVVARTVARELDSRRLLPLVQGSPPSSEQRVEAKQLQPD